MITRKKKICKHCGELCYYFSNKLCIDCWKSENPPKLKKTSIEKKSYKIKKVSKTQAKRLEKYKALRDIYMQNNPLCEARLEGCTIKSTELHHRKGRDGENLFKHFCGLCHNCHSKIELGGQDAKDQGFTISRLKPDE